ncbi:MAG TPA: endolytic transglycosylase MltG, partial [Lacibacter sp.]|nr:endolytic transglycosylase MltG [Lacibacter sp.]
MKKIIGYSFLVLCLVALFFAWKFFGSATTFKESKKYLYIYTGNVNQKAVMQSLNDSGFLKNPGLFETVAGRLNVWERLRPGKYEIEKSSSLFALARKLRNGSQTPVNLVITKLRTRHDLAALIGRKFETDSAMMMSYLVNNDSLRKYNLDTNTVMTAVFPNTYS